MDNCTPLDDETRRIRSEELSPPCRRGIWASACWNAGRYGVCLHSAESPVTIFVPENDFAKFRKRWQSAPAHFLDVFEAAARRLPQFRLRMGGVKRSN